uniref:DNA helicase n=1 Tax=Dermatophagoides pteronyssinus TaxID=6956 RepID=A0A6P6XM84_DERPT|nr:DNA replication licensing factor Mcm2-like [Dermatophagoides pteronyssinus]
MNNETFNENEAVSSDDNFESEISDYELEDTNHEDLESEGDENEEEEIVDDIDGHDIGYTHQDIKMIDNDPLEENDEDDMLETQAFQIGSMKINIDKPSLNAVEAVRASLVDCLVNEIPQKIPTAYISSFNNEKSIQSLKIIFEGFLWYFQVNESTGVGKYIKLIQQCVYNEDNFLVIDYRDLNEFDQRFTNWLINFPDTVLPFCNEIVLSIAKAINPSVYVKKAIACRISNFPFSLRIREITPGHINKFICVEGICIKRTEASPQLKIVYYKCLICGSEINGPYRITIHAENTIKKICLDCQSKGPFLVSQENTVYENYQQIVLQELTSTIPPGDIPNQFTVELFGSLTNVIKPGDDVLVTGQYEVHQSISLVSKAGFSLFTQTLKANYIQKRKSLRIKDLSPTDIKIFYKLSKHPQIRQKLIKSIAPAVWGNQFIKTALVATLFGGNRKLASEGHNIRGDINVLLIGDPGMGKSQFLKYVEHIFPKTILTTGKGASGVGLTAVVKRNTATGEWSLEAGAFVCADQGICLIDEFDKMTEQDRVSIHEAMEQQSITISKAGIVASLQARCSVIAAANPIGDKYNPTLNLSRNVDLSGPILSRFDIICIIRDKAFPLQDLNLANHVINSHIFAHSANDEKAFLNSQKGIPRWVINDNIIPEEYLTKYIMYARETCFPKLQPQNESKIVNFYTTLRQVTAHSGNMPMTVRNLESLLRISTAFAKMRLSPVSK